MQIKKTNRFTANPLSRKNQQNVNTKVFLQSAFFNVSGI